MAPEGDGNGGGDSGGGREGSDTSSTRMQLEDSHASDGGLVAFGGASGGSVRPFPGHGSAGCGDCVSTGHHANDQGLTLTRPLLGSM
jgi:hypothetical protein